jgi:hypothetical protein
MHDISEPSDEEVAGGNVYTGGPYLFVALPTRLSSFDLFPLNVSRLLAEWEEAIDPVQAAMEAAREALPYDWIMGERFAVPSWSTAGWLRALAQEHELADYFARGTLAFQGDAFRLEQFAFSDPPGRFVVKGGAQPILLGLGALAAAIEPVGLVGEQVHARLRERVGIRVWGDLRGVLKEPG